MSVFVLYHWKCSFSLGSYNRRNIYWLSWTLYYNQAIQEKTSRIVLRLYLWVQSYVQVDLVVEFIAVAQRLVMKAVAVESLGLPSWHLLKLKRVA